MLDLEAYKKEKNLCSQDVVNRISKYYPKFDLPLELAVCDDDTGVVLDDRAEAVLTTEYGPVPKRRERRRKDSRCSTRLTAGQAKLVKKTLTAHGMTMQKLLYNAIDAFMRVAAPEEWKKENARTAATVPSAGSSDGGNQPMTD